MLKTSPFLGAVNLKGSPSYAKRGLAQGSFVDLRPNINIESPKIAPVINVELGGLPLSLGLFAGSAVLLYIKGQLPEGWPKMTALLAGGLLAAGGIMNLVLPKAVASSGATSAPGATPAPVASAPSSVPGSAGLGPQAYNAPSVSSFDGVTGRIVQPADFSTVDIWPWSSSYPVRIQLMNSGGPATFELELTAEEDPAPLGTKTFSTLPVQVSLNAGEVKDIDVNMPITSWSSLVEYVDIMLTAKKRRVPGESAQLVDMKSFVVE